MDEDLLGALDDQLTRLLRRIRHPEVRARLVAGVDRPLDRAPHVVLVRVARLAPVRLSELAEELDVDVSTASRQIAALAEAGLVDRSPDPEDRRATRLSPTPEGEAVLTELREARRRALAEVLGEWGEGDVTTLTALLGRLVDDLAGPT